MKALTYIFGTVAVIGIIYGVVITKMYMESPASEEVSAPIDTLELETRTCICASGPSGVEPNITAEEVKILSDQFVAEFDQFSSTSQGGVLTSETIVELLDQSDVNALGYRFAFDPDTPERLYVSWGGIIITETGPGVYVYTEPPNPIYFENKLWCPPGCIVP